jgi:hypothetical protein
MCHFDTNGPTVWLSMIPLYSPTTRLSLSHLPAGGRSVLRAAGAPASFTNARRPRAPPSMILSNGSFCNPCASPCILLILLHCLGRTRPHTRRASFFSVYAPATCSSPCCLPGLMSLPPSQIKGSCWLLLPNYFAFHARGVFVLMPGKNSYAGPGERNNWTCSTGV